jgi:hypothetical protein
MSLRFIASIPIGSCGFSMRTSLRPPRGISHRYESRLGGGFGGCKQGDVVAELAIFIWASCLASLIVFTVQWNAA